MITVSLKDKVLLTVDEAVAFSGIGKNTLNQLIKKHPELVLKVGRSLRVRREALVNYIQGVDSIEPFDFSEYKSRKK